MATMLGRSSVRRRICRFPEPMVLPTTRSQVMEITCTCGNLLRVADDLIGKRVKCPQCGENLQMLEIAEEPAPVLVKRSQPRDDQDDSPPRRKPRAPQKRSAAALIIAIASGALLVVGVTAGGVLLAVGKRKPDSTANHSASPQDQKWVLGLPDETNVQCLAYSPDGKLLAGSKGENTPAGYKRLIKVWNLANREVVTQLEDDMSHVSYL